MSLGLMHGTMALSLFTVKCTLGVGTASESTDHSLAS
jgi:hypothetical protein